MSTKYFLSVIVGCFFLTISACSSEPSDSAIQTAIAQTVIAPSQGASTPIVELTSQPISTPKPRVSCSDDEVSLYLSELALLLEKFDDTAEIAGSTSRLGLAPIIQDMQSQKRDARQLNRPECANYLQDLIIVAMETEIDSFISFLSQDSDSVVARKMIVSDEVRSMVNEEISLFESNPLGAYEASELTSDSLLENADQSEPFILPDGWININFPDSDKLLLSIPNSWSQGTFGEEGQYLELKNDDETMTVIMDVFEEKVYTQFDSDQARLFNLQTLLETEDWDFYLEHSSEIGVYSLNRGYVVEFSRRYLTSSDIVENLWAVVVTPETDEIFIIASTERDEFAQIDLLTLQEIFGSIRSSD